MSPNMILTCVAADGEAAEAAAAGPRGTTDQGMMAEMLRSAGGSGDA